jgi:hypothetical protein
MDVNPLQCRNGKHHLWSFGALSALLAGYVLILSIGSIADFPSSMQSGQMLPFLSDKPIGEDGFYMLTVAYNLALGNGISYNFQIPTTGVQPLATILFSIIAKFNLDFGGNKWSYLREIIVFTGLLHIFLAYLIGLLSSEIAKLAGQRSSVQSRAFLLGGGLTLFSIGLFKLSTYGLETPVYLCSVSIVLISLLRNESRIATRNFRYSLTLCFFIGVSVLARIDALVLWTVFYLSLLFSKKISLGNVITTLGFTGLVSLPWFIYVYSLTGSLVPSSGGAQSSLLSLDTLGSRLHAFALSLLSHASIMVAPGRNFLAIGSLILVAIYVVFMLRKPRARRVVVVASSDSVMKSFVIAVATLCIVYPIFFWASHFYFRYTSPFSVAIIPTFAAMIASAVGSRQTTIILALAVILFAGQAIGSFHTGSIGSSHSVSAGYISSYFKDKKYIVGAFQSGVIGYFNEHTVNLDGKLDPIALQALRRNSIHKYAAERGVNVIVDWKFYVNGILELFRHDGDMSWVACPLEINNKDSVCIMRK